ncbi:MULTISPECIES: hypothetical protein [unclassified Mesorhizobium]|uniref:hypothetical protein n=1 Tax=unclassified Mesorhizobium TaxID=325217 RepID=UPI00112E34F6|nr:MULTISPECIES: hypothetical protein [unclassified Mesorhizobium]TPJ38154.1 hypothetical protein FJ437_30715 [Mesorhizobium sp. B2-6-6]MCA0000924.1 hypothetical protein [Mesorhizobium sp. B264B2A]MCA0004673.1 hypothetical protein [Mesorhizobium sp. B264B1B]MCA0019128.1 hypothetical protein [Mesorhizobium sp. B264B1A]TPJ52271.1 hypothetical protein FJ462_33380 [Mesorhizobium sp. B2-6-7]
MTIITSFTTLKFKGSDYEFSHLLPFGHTLSAAGKDGADIRVRVSYQSHVFSRRRETDEEFHLVDEAGKPRVFCPDRYSNSLRFPAFCQRMLSENMLTWESKDRNRVSNMAVMDGALKSGDHQIAVYYLFPSSVDGLDVEMVIKSGYSKLLNFEHIKRRYNVVQLVKKCHYSQAKVPQ